MDCPVIEGFVAEQRSEDQTSHQVAAHAKDPHTGENENASELAQPWKKLLDEITADNEANPLDKDFFRCKDGFYSHSLTA